MADDRTERALAISRAVAAIEERFGKGAIMRLGERTVVEAPAISTACLGLDAALGVGGVPRGRIVEIYGPESSGKTTLASHIVAMAQKAGGVAAYIDAENALDSRYAEALGVNTAELFVSQPDSGEQALKICQTLVGSGGFDIVVVDSVAALVPLAQIDGLTDDGWPGLHGRLTSQALRTLTTAASRSNTCLLFVNQIREETSARLGSSDASTGAQVLCFDPCGASPDFAHPG